MAQGLIQERVSEESLREATGRGWEQLFGALDGAGAADLAHRDIVELLDREFGVESGWWRQSIAVAYEQARGKRVVGQTADAGFQVGVQRTLAGSPREVWELITGRPELWLGDGGPPSFERGARYKAGGASGEIRVVKPGDRLRLTWQPAGWAAPATLQLTLTERGPGRTALGVHLEKLPDADSREAMRTHWRAVLDRMAAAVGAAA